MKQQKFWLVSILLIIGITNTVFSQKVANNGNQPPHSFPEYSEKYTKNQLAPILEPGSVFYVSNRGNNKSIGTKKSPFKSIEAARDAIRKLKASKGLPKGGIHVILLDGTYHINQTINLTPEDSGTEEAPIVYRGIKRGNVILSGGLEIDTKRFKIVKDNALLNRLHPNAKGKVISMDLSKDNVSRYFQGEGKYGQIALDGYMLQLAQWPNRGYNHISEIVEEGPTTRWLKPGEKPMPFTKENPTGGKFIFKEAFSPAIRSEFERTGDIRAQGYFHNDWYFQDEPVGSIKNNVVQLLHHTRYGIVNKIKTVPRRVRLFNVLAELDEPGEWYFDKKDQRLYLWPIEGFNPKESTLTIIGNQAESVNKSFEPVRKRKSNNKNQSLLSLNNTEYLTFRDFVIENTGDLAVKISGGKYNLLAGSDIRNGSGKGVIIEHGTYNGITGCDFYDLYSAFSIKGGDFVTITPSYNFATNNVIRNCRLRGYGVVGLSGVGIYFAHNLLHSMNGAVMYETVDMLMEYNEYYNIGYEMGDFNVAYCGAQWYTMNNVLRYNFVHHLIEPGGHPITAFRNDDNGAGMKVYGNVFYRPGRGSCIFHGFLNDFQNNINVDATIMWWTLKKPITPEGIKERWDGLAKFGRDLPKGDKGDYIYIMESVIGKDGWKKGAWKEKFPELEQAIDKNPWAQTGCNVNLNYAYKIKQPFHIHGGDGTVEGLESTYEGAFADLPKDEVFEFPKPITPDAFKDITKLDFSFKDGFKLMEGFKPIPFNDIGLVKDEFRLKTLDKNIYRNDVYEHFKNDKGGRYNAEIVNARYPKPSYFK
ncbi:right-handed parallel beta-helix repeat-containing protein [Flavivirga amylovorans]|uniref:Right-handed parallel beta-helix repeat-containing protein n=1 Tax=Flavivirga amylovorans TaxID=870486 RepID=A0ABT8WYX5_9FLAO|nr:right-handed parallel beta-helix repeat-containing protein [Flavivirga amylovorans]MDO5986574.1 right-handed parallel beta-helix repeat-containing protein [Flavivirga amylovorans]